MKLRFGTRALALATAVVLPAAFAYSQEIASNTVAAKAKNSTTSGKIPISAETGPSVSTCRTAIW
jgi:hypothetical protein